MTIIDLITPKCGETWIYKKYKQMKEKTVVTLLMEELDAEMKMGTKMVLNWDKYLEMEKEQIIEAFDCDVSPEPGEEWISNGQQYYNKTYGKE